MGSMGKGACAYDNSLMESFFGSMQIEHLDRRTYSTRAKLANGIFEWIESFYNPVRRHSGLECLSPIEFENLPTTANSFEPGAHQTLRKARDRSDPPTHGPVCDFAFAVRTQQVVRRTSLDQSSTSSHVSNAFSAPSTLHRPS